MSHVIDMAHALCGPINRVSANQHTFIKARPLATSGEGTHYTTQEGGSVGEVTNEDYVGALVQFDNGARGTLEACRVIVGHPCEMAFEVNGTRGALSWNFERMNELNLYLTEEDDRIQGRRLIFNGPEHPHYARFYPGPANALGYEDLKLIEAYQFVQSIVGAKQGSPGFAEALAVASVQHAMQCVAKDESWQAVRTIRIDP